MSLVINTTFITQDEIIALSNFDFNKQLVAVKNEEIVILSKRDITFFQLFLSLFNRGNLAHMQWDLSKVSTYLSKLDWQTNGSMREKSSDEYRAYLKVYELAIKALYSRNETALIEKVQFGGLNAWSQGSEMIGVD